MTDVNDIEAQVGEYVLGTMTGAERDAFERTLAGDPALKAAVDVWQNRMVGLAESQAEMAPPAGIWAAIESEIADDGGVQTILADQGEWRTISPGAEVKMLFTDDTAGTFSYLVRVQPNAPMAMHRHGGVEECLVLEGEIVANGVTLGPGDYQVGTAGTAHEELCSPKGALLYIRSTESPLPNAA